jgi:cobalt-zinc-cadmium efflux system protein
VLKWAMVATLGLVVTELVGGYLGHSIALISDAVHNLSDIPTIAISWFALRWAERPATSEKTYGYHRGGILAAFTNAILLAVVALFLFYEAYERLRHPVVVHEQVMIWISLAALGVNGGITLALVSGRRDLNLRSILVHNLGDALSNLSILAGALAIRATAARNAARRRGPRHPERPRCAGSPRYPHLDARNRSPRAFLPRTHPGYAYG